MSTAINVAILVSPYALASSVYGIMDIFAGANYCSEDMGEEFRPFRVSVISAEGCLVKSFYDQIIQPHGDIDLGKKADIIILAPIMTVNTSPDRINDILESAKPLLPLIKDLAGKGKCIASACTGSFLLAETGLLNGKVATTHWKVAQEFRKRYPHVLLQDSDLVTNDGNIVCAGGAFSYIDLTLYLIEKFACPLLAVKCAQLMVVDSGRDLQSPYVSFGSYKKHTDKVILKCQEWIEANYSQQIHIEDLAKKFGMSPRNFKRRFKAACGEPPLQYMQKIRIASACELLATSTLSIQKVIWKVGYMDASSFCRLFKRRIGITMEEYRNKFQRK